MRGVTTKEVLLSSNNKYGELDRKLTYLGQLTSTSKDKEIIVPEFDVEEERVDFNVEEDAKGLRLIIK